MDTSHTKILGSYRTPSNYEKFNFDYKRSEFVECDKKSSQNVFSKRAEHKKDIVESILKITTVLDESMINYWVSDETALGLFSIYPKINKRIFDNTKDAFATKKCRLSNSRIIE